MKRLREEEGLLAGATNERSFSGAWSVAIKVCCGLGAVYYALYNGLILSRLGFYISPAANAAGALGLLTVLALLFRSARKQTTVVTNRLPWYDIVLIVGALVAFFYPMFFYRHFAVAAMGGYLPTPQVVLTLVAVITLLEASRRVLGIILPIIALVAASYLFLTEYAPGPLQMHDLEPSRIAWMLYASEYGLFGVAMKVAATIIIVFVIFAAFLQHSRAGEAFINLSLALLGHVRGGPAKVAVVASAAFGTFSGSPSANVAGTGVVTIPLMKSIGYTPEFAGAVEAVASTGGQIMPPVMGAVAFIMADWLGISYLSIVIAAVVPALLYYLAIFIMVDAQAVKLGLHGLPRAQLPKFWGVFKSGWYWFLPIIVILIALTVFRYSPAYSGFLALLSIFPLTFLKGERRFTLKSVSETFQGSMTTMLHPGLACGLAGVLIGAVQMSGMGVKLSSMIVQFAGGNTLLLLVMAAFAALVLGMGLPAIPVYIMVVVLVAPALAKMDIPLLTSHMFVFYYGMLSFVTPPVAIAAYVAAAIAKCDPMRTGLWATRLAVVAFLIPFGMVYNPAIMLNGSTIDILRGVILALVGTVFIAFGIGGYAFTKVNWLQRILFVIGGVMMYLPTWEFYAPAIAMTSVVLLWHLQKWRVARTAPRALAAPQGSDNGKR